MLSWWCRVCLFDLWVACVLGFGVLVGVCGLCLLCWACVVCVCCVGWFLGCWFCVVLTVV